MNNTAKALKAFIQCSGITDPKLLSEQTGIHLKTIYRCLKLITKSILIDENSLTDEILTGENSLTGENGTGLATRAPSYTEENNINNNPYPLNSRQHRTNPRALGTNPRAKRTNPCLVEPERFAEFWNLYPRKVGKGQARNAWPKAIKAAGNSQTIIDGLTAKRDSLADKGKFCPHPATWLNGERWADEDGASATSRAERVKQLLAEGKDRNQIKLIIEREFQ